MFKKSRCAGLCLIVAILLTHAFVHPAIAGENALTAQYFLRLLPANIFEQTEWPISEDEKNYLAEVGHLKQWFIKENTFDLLVITGSSVEKSEMRIKVFRNPSGGGVVVVCTEGALPCMAQFWEFDNRGRLVPMDEEPAVDVSDYFFTSSILPPSIGFSTTFCLRDERVEALPSFWNMSGLLDIPVEKRVFFVWKRDRFIKDSVSHSILLDTSQD